MISLVPMANALTAKIERKRKWKQAPVAQRRGFLCLNDNRSTMKNARSHWVCSTALSPFRKRLPHYHTVMRGFSAVLNRSLVRVSFCCTFIVVIWDSKEKKNRATCRVCYIKEKCKIHRSKKVVKFWVWINIRSFMGIYLVPVGTCRKVFSQNRVNYTGCFISVLLKKTQQFSWWSHAWVGNILKRNIIIFILKIKCSSIFVK